MECLKTFDDNLIPIIVTEPFLKDCSEDYGYFAEAGWVLPYYRKKKSIFSYIRFVTGVIKVEKEVQEDEATFLNHLVAYVKENKMTDMIIAPHTTAVFHAIPDNSVACEFGSYIIDLSKNEDDLFAGVHTKHRNVIRKAARDGVTISNAENYKEACKNLVNETAERQHINVITEESFNEMKRNPNVDFWVAIFNGKVVGASILEWSHYSSYYIYGGSAEHTQGGAMDLLHWEAIKKMKERGVLYYDFVGARINPKPGSKQEGIQRFKARFGGELDKGYMWKFSFNPIKSAIYYFYIKLNGLLHHSYTKDIIDQENEKK